MILDLVHENDPILNEKLPRFDFSNPSVDPSQLAIDLTETMLSKKGIGLAANQVGWRHRLFVVSASPVICCFNPIIVDRSEKTNVLEEGCLSFPGLLIKMVRSDSIKIRYTQPNGETVTKIFQGMTARVMQHEYAHLEGGLFSHGLSRIQLEIAIKKCYKNTGKKYNLSDLWRKSEA